MLRCHVFAKCELLRRSERARDGTEDGDNDHASREACDIRASLHAHENTCFDAAKDVARGNELVCDPCAQVVPQLGGQRTWALGACYSFA